MLVELHAVFARLFRPPRRDDIQRETAVTDVVDVRRLLGQQRGVVEGGSYCNHQLQPMRDRRKRSGGGPGIERWLFRAFDVIQVELCDQRKVIADLLTAARQPAHVGPCGLHLLIFHIAQPAAKNRKPVSVSHYAASFSRKSTRRVKGSKPTTLGPSATKFESAL